MKNSFKTGLIILAVGGIIAFVLSPIFKKLPLLEKSGGTIIQASIGDATYLNPVLATDSASGDINGLIYNGLVKYDKNLELTGDLAESWEISKDNL